MKTAHSRHFSLAAAVLFSLAACGDGTGPAPASPATAEPAASSPEPTERAPRAVRGELAAPLPEGVSLPFAYYVRSDAATESKQGLPRRRIRLEFLEGDAATVLGQVRAAFASAGFSAGEDAAAGNGATRVNFRKDGYGRVTAVVGPIANAVDPRAQGQLILDWPAEDPGGE